MKMFDGAHLPGPIPANIPLLNKPKIQPTRTLPPEMLHTIIACLVKQRSQDSELLAVITRLVEERHNHFHVHRQTDEPDFRKCTNQVCNAHNLFLEQRALLEVDLSSFEIQQVGEYRVAYQVRPGCIHISLVDKPAVESMPESKLIVVPR
jgi:hypothetical protein